MRFVIVMKNPETVKKALNIFFAVFWLLIASHQAWNIYKTIATPEYRDWSGEYYIVLLATSLGLLMSLFNFFFFKFKTETNWINYRKLNPIMMARKAYPNPRFWGER